MTPFRAFARLIPLCSLPLLALACSSSSPAADPTGEGGSTSAGASAGGSTNQAGSTSAGAAGALNSGGSSPGGGAPSAGGGGAGAAGSAGTGVGGAAAGAGGADPNGDPLPARPLNVTAPPALYHHTKLDSKNNDAGVDTRSAKMAGKLVIDLYVTQGHFNASLAAKGFHSMGVLQANKCDQINGALNDPALGRAYDGDCRLNTLDGKPHGAQASVKPADSIMTQVATNLQLLQTSFPKEDWGYFLNADGSVRWSDVAWTGYSHGATSAVLFAFTLRSYRAVAMSGPRDNLCGTGAAKGTDYNPAMPPYNTACPSSKIAAWLDTPSATPIDRFFSFVGLQDSEYGDIMFAANYLKFVGMPTNISTGVKPYGGSHRFYAATGHSDFSSGFDDAVNIAFGVLTENLKTAP